MDLFSERFISLCLILCPEQIPLGRYLAWAPSQTDTPSDGVITGHGLIDGNLVFIYSQDASVLGGTIGEMHAKKVAAVYDMAVKMGAPVIGLIDCAGHRIFPETAQSGA